MPKPSLIRMMLKNIAVIGPLLLLSFAIYVLIQKPSDDRDWRYNLTEKTRVIELQDESFRFQNVRAFEYNLDDEFSRKEWINVDIDAASLKDVWFFLEPFPGSDKFGHTLLSFVFEDTAGQQSALSISVEARKEEGEEYTAVNALFRRFELLYVWSTEKDVLGRIGVHRDHDIYAYKLNLSPEQAQAIFRHFITRTNELADKPRFYNTIHSNCTNELAKAVNTAFPGALKLSPPWIMTGHAPRWLHELGYIVDPETDFDVINNDANISEEIKAVIDTGAEEFPSAWRNQLNSTD